MKAIYRLKEGQENYGKAKEFYGEFIDVEVDQHEDYKKDVDYDGENGIGISWYEFVRVELPGSYIIGDVLSCVKFGLEVIK